MNNETLLNKIISSSAKESLQLEAAKLALAGRFKDSVEKMLVSLDLPETDRPEWVFPKIMLTQDNLDQTSAIGDIFTYKALFSDVGPGQIAASILMGHYGQAVHLMGEIERLASNPLPAIPEDFDEMLKYMDEHPFVVVANDSFQPSWL